MSRRTLFLILMALISLVVSSVLFWLILTEENLPQKPCSSIIKNSKLIDDLQRPYQLQGTITWWPHDNRLTLFGMKKDEKSSLIFDRAVQLQAVKKHGGVVQGTVDSVSKASVDQLPPDYKLIGEKGRDLTLFFKKIDSDRWLMMIDDNWVMMCEYK